ncbi:MAG: dihydroneopterin aldolase [Rikenellaceae bacterium]
MHYTIKLSDMEFRAYHGCYDLEQVVGNRFVVNIEIATSQKDIAADDITQAVNYLTVYDIVEHQMSIKQRTIEAVALNIIEALKRDIPQIEGVRCEVAKLAPPLGGKIGRVSVLLEE